MSEQRVKAGFRVSTGPMRVDDDWLGVFWRGDDAGAEADMLRAAARRPKENWVPRYLSELAAKFASSHEKYRIRNES